MNRPAQTDSLSKRPPRGYTLIEILIATALTLVLMTVVVRIFAAVSSSVADARATLEMSDRVRGAATRLQKDLAGVTARMLPPQGPESDAGYFQITEGPIGPLFEPDHIAVDENNNDEPDMTVSDFDDMLMFTTQSMDRPFVGRYWNGGPSTIESDTAEIAWFVRGNTLYRRVLLVAPAAPIVGPRDGFYERNDISVRVDSGGNLVANTLGNLTRHEARYAHRASATSNGDPCHPHFDVNWQPTPVPRPTKWATVRIDAAGMVEGFGLGLPTLRECSANSANGASTAWTACDLPLNAMTPVPLRNSKKTVDFWNSPHPWDDAVVDRVSGTMKQYMGTTPRVAEDVILTNVVGFDVKVWDPNAPVFADPSGAANLALFPGDGGPEYLQELQRFVNGMTTPISFGAYVDLNYGRNISPPPSAFAGPGDVQSGMPRVYDTWSSDYENDWVDEDGDGQPGTNELGNQRGDNQADRGCNGFDDDTDPTSAGYGIVDDPSERETSPPYPVPLTAIQIKIRVFEPDSRQIREVTIVQDFLPK